MKVCVAEEAGFCFGVKRALEIIEQLHEKGQNICIYGQLIHNTTVLDDLKARGIDRIDSIDQLDPAKTLIIRTHGIPKESENNLKSHSIHYVDATCPLVKKLQQVIEKLASTSTQIIIVGDKNHPEIIAARSYASSEYSDPIIINSEEEANELAFFDRIDVVAQTTLDVDLFNQITFILQNKTEHFHIHNTICKATQVRQAAIKKLAPNVDFVIVAGGKNSSNTRKLFNIALKQNKNTFHIESSKELFNPDFIRKIEHFNSVGITAGASTPPDEIDKIKNFFEKFTIEKEMNHGRTERNSNAER